MTEQEKQDYLQQLKEGIISQAEYEYVMEEAERGLADSEPPEPLPRVPEWHVAVNGQSQGPVHMASLSEILMRGEITRQTLVWNPRMKEWAAIENAPELKDMLARLPPPLTAASVSDEPEAESLQSTSELEARYAQAQKLYFWAKYEEALPLLESLANEAYAPALYDLGNCYFNGEGVAQDSVQAAEWWLRAAEQGNPFAQFGIGDCYANGDGVAQDTAKAAEWWGKAAEQGGDWAQRLGNRYYFGKGVTQDYAKAVKWYGKAAEDGHAEAQYDLGYCYYFGRGVKVDYAKAAEWYGKSAEQENADAQCRLGFCYKFGKGVKQDQAKAIEWWTRAAENGDSLAQHEIGVCLLNGTGTAKDEAKAFEWFGKAAEQGEKKAQSNLALCYFNGQGAAQDQAKAIALWQEAAEQGSSEAQNNLGFCFYFGKGVAQDYDKAAEWYGKCAEQGNPQGQFSIGLCYLNGQGVKEDEAKAIEWWLKSAALGNTGAMYKLGVCISQGIGAAQDEAKAAEWYRKAADLGHAEAQYQLGRCYVVGEGVPEDIGRAVELFKKSAAQGNAEAKEGLETLKDALPDLDAVKCNTSYFMSDTADTFRKDAEQGDAEAQFRLGNCYYHGMGTEQDFAKAAEWFYKSAEQGYAEAQFRLGHCCEYDIGVKASYDDAKEWYEKAGRQGNANALCLLASGYFSGSSMYLNGGYKSDLVKNEFKVLDALIEKLHTASIARLGLKLDTLYERKERMDEVFAYYSMAAERGDFYSINNLGTLYHTGKGIDYQTKQRIKKDLDKARELYEKAASMGCKQAKYNLAELKKSKPPIIGIFMKDEYALAHAEKNADLVGLLALPENPNRNSRTYTIPVPDHFNLVGTTWTLVHSGVDLSPADYQFYQNGGLSNLGDRNSTCSWRQTADSVILKDGAVYTLKPVNPGLMKGNAKNMWNKTWTVEFRKKG